SASLQVAVQARLLQFTRKIRNPVTGPGGPCAPGGPGGPAGPGGPGGPASPLGPGGPAGPGSPFGPCGPLQAASRIARAATAMALVIFMTGRLVIVRIARGPVGKLT